MGPAPSTSRTSDPRLYRISFVPALAALVVLMFSLEGIPGAIEPVTPTGAFEGDRAVAAARQIARLAPERPAGSEGDEAVAGLVEERFGQIPAGTISEQRFEATVEDDEVETRNVLLTLPGDAARTVVVLAGRTQERGPGAASSAAATAVLLELAAALGVSGHESTYVLASTAGGAAGARELLAGLPERDSIEAAIAISQPGASDPREPFAVTTSTTTQSGSVQLRRTAERAIESQTGRVSGVPSWFSQLARLAFPSGLGEQAPLVGDGIDAIAVSAAGEPPLPEADDGPEDLSPEAVDGFGRSAHFLVGAVDIAPELDHGPPTYVEGADNLVPGWTLAALGLALLLPALVAAIDACARAARRGGELIGAISWAAARSLPFVGGLAALYGLAFAALIPRPDFPFDPELYSAGARFAVAAVLIVGAAAASAYALRRLRVTAARAPAGSVAATGLVSAVACLVIWIANPYLALLVAPAAHVWLLADRRRGRLTAAIIAAFAILAVLPAIAAVVAVADALDLGGDAPWTLALMVADGQIGLPVAAALCFVAGGLVAAFVLAADDRGRLPAPP
jgi:hypothetical protein